MASVLLLSAVPESDPRWPRAHEDVKRLRRWAERDVFGVHTLTSDPEEADLILYVEHGRLAGRFFDQVRRHPYVKRFRRKCFLVSRLDNPVPFLPGVYASIEKRWYSRQWVRSGYYLSVTEDEYGHEEEPDVALERPYLFSFMGHVENAPVRARLAELDHPRGFFFDTSTKKVEVERHGSPEEKGRYRRRYVDVMRKSKFVLCPRGKGVSSLRLFESMRMGRVPVIISDQWVPPEGPEWDAFSIRVAERAVHGIPALLEERESEAEEMGRRAREAWENWYGEEVIFHRIVEWCLEIERSRWLPEPLLRIAARAPFLSPAYLRDLLRRHFRRRGTERASPRHLAAIRE